MRRIHRQNAFPEINDGDYRIRDSGLSPKRLLLHLCNQARLNTSLITGSSRIPIALLLKNGREAMLNARGAGFLTQIPNNADEDRRKRQ